MSIVFLCLEPKAG